LSQYPQRVLTDVSVAWDPHANGAARATFARHGTVVDIAPGGLLELAYGGSGNLSGVIPASQCGNEQCLDRAAVSNLWQPTAS
jgi:hypothetical protein